MLVLIGSGLGGFRDLTLRALEYIREADFIYMEMYTSLFSLPQEEFREVTGRDFTPLSRAEVEEGDVVLEAARRGTAVLITVGDPLTATTHVDLLVRARREGIKTLVLHNASVLTAVPGLLGLQHYKFGRTVSIPRPQGNFFPTSYYDHIEMNRKMGLHTLLLLDLNPPMTANEAMSLLMEVERRVKRGVIAPDMLICVVARAGSEEPIVRAGPLRDLMEEDFGPPPHSLVIPGPLHFMEEEALRVLAGWRGE